METTKATIIAIVVLLVIAALVISLGNHLYKQSGRGEAPVPSQAADTATSDNLSTAPGANSAYCTLDAKICPDGTAVGRIPPACDFAACPGR